MRYVRDICAILGLLAAVALPAVAGDMALAKNGTLYRLAQDSDELKLSVIRTDGTSTILPIPQTAAVDASHLEVAFDDATATVFLLWQDGDDETAQVVVATYSNGTWWGPAAIAGGGPSATNPTLFMQRVSTTVEEDDGPVTYSTTLAHVAWWEDLEGEDAGYAMVAVLPVEDDGEVDLAAAATLWPGGLIPWGVVCYNIPDPLQLARPRLFLDLQSGDPHLLLMDLRTCLFQIVQLQPELGEPDPITKRRRHTTIWGHHEMIATNPTMAMATAKAEIGLDLSVVLYWDQQTRIDYVNLTAAGWSELKSLPLSQSLTHDRAVELIRGLTR